MGATAFLEGLGPPQGHNGRDPESVAGARATLVLAGLAHAPAGRGPGRHPPLQQLLQRSSCCPEVTEEVAVAKEGAASPSRCWARRDPGSNPSPCRALRLCEASCPGSVGAVHGAGPAQPCSPTDRSGRGSRGLRLDTSGARGWP